MRYLSICSGIEAATVAAHPLGWEPAAFAEIEPFPSAVLAHHYPTVPNLGDFTKVEAHHVGTVDLLVGGTPCQAFSVAGKRIGLDDPRGNLTLEFLALAGRLRPHWVVWENVSGVLSIDGGRTFGAILGALGQLGYGFAYRVLDAQHFGVPQRRRRVFVVGCAGGDWQRAAAVLFERAGLCGDSPAGGEARKDVAGTLDASSGGADENDAADGRLIAQCVTTGTGRRYDAETETLVPVAFGWQNSAQQGDSCGNVSPALDKSKTPAVLTSGVRRLMPVECERLQGFPDGWTDVPVPSRRGEASRVELARLGVDVPPTSKPAADGPRYKAIGNSMAVPVMRWIFERIAMVDAA